MLNLKFKKLAYVLHSIKPLDEGVIKIQAPLFW